MAIDISRQLKDLADSTNGKQARVPIAEMLQNINDSGGNVLGITDGTNIYTYKSFYTAEQVYDTFKDGTYIIDFYPKKVSDRKKAMTSACIYRQLRLASAILDKIIGETGGNTNGE